MTWTAPELDLRTVLSDKVDDKLRYRKRVLGEVNGVNTRFKTFEFRRVTDFTLHDSVLGVFLNGSLLAPGSIASDYLATGDFVLTTPPVQGDIVEASYYVQWFTDAEIIQFLRISSNWLSLGDDYTNIIEGLRPAALKYASAEAYQKLSLRWAEALSETFLLNDAPQKDRFAIVDSYRKQSQDMRKEAEAVRDDFYSRSGKQKQPSYGSVLGSVRDNVPKR